MDRETHACEEHAGAEAGDEVQEDPGYGGSVYVKEVEEARAGDGEHPAGPDRPAVAACEGDKDADDDGGGGDGEGLWEEGDAGEDGGFAFDGFVVEGHVVEHGPEDHAVDERAEVVGGCGAVLEDGEGDKRVGGEVLFVEDEGDEAEDTED